jgi:surface protein
MAESFNSDLSSWNVANVANMTGMFYGAASFNQSLCSWQEVLSVNAAVEDLFKSTACIHTSDPIRDQAADTSFCTACR